tara:strand:+ start:703 stop:2238 length:1536 start_codon:yes stop_codon:yes gene_type:complete
MKLFSTFFILGAFLLSGLNGFASLELDSLRLQGVIDFDVPSGGSDGKAIHVYAVEDIVDLSAYGLGTANNGGGTDGEEYSFPAQSLAAGEHLLLARSTGSMSGYLGACIGQFQTVLEASSAINQNGNDAIELYHNGAVVETYGDVDEDGTGTSWDYADSWAYQAEPGQWETASVGCSEGATSEDSSCPYPLCDEAEGIPGCMNSASCNFDAEATVDDLSCTYPGDPCDDDDPLTVFDVLNENCLCAGQVFTPSNSLILTGVVHNGAAPKMLEFYVTDDMETLAQYGIGSAQNGAGTDGIEWTFPDESADANTFIYVANDTAAFTDFFGFPPTFVDGGAACNFNGNDAIELFEAGVGVDVFGEINVDGIGAEWEYTGGWAYRVDGTGPDGFQFVQPNWMMSSLDALDGAISNGFSNEPFPVGTYNATSNPDDVTERGWSTRCFPNPTSGVLFLESSQPLAFVRIMNVQGQIMREWAAEGIEAPLNLSGLSTGCYFLRIESAAESRLIQILLQ